MADLVNVMIFLPSLAAILCLIVPAKQQARWIALLASVATLLLSVILMVAFDRTAAGPQFVTAVQWIPLLNAEFRTGIDGLNLPLVLLTTSLSVLVVLASWSIEKSANAFLALYLFLLTGMLGVFLSLDLLLFYVFFELSLLPMYFLIGIWGGPRRKYAAVKFFLYTLAGSLCLLAVMLGLYFVTSTMEGGNTWDMMKLQSGPVAQMFTQGGEHWVFAKWAFVLTLIAFLIKLPAVPFHTWLPDAHVEAPTPISMVLAGVLLKMGGYALMRITYPMFPDAGRVFWLFVATLGVIAILYGALCAMAQTDWKRLVAYSSVSHMGFVTLGLAVMTRTAWDGAYYQMIGHGVSSAMMFFVVGVVYDRAHHRDINRLGGMWLNYPSFGGWSLVAFLAGMGLPGLCGFIGELLVLLGTFQAAEQFNPMTAYVLGGLAASGMILTAGYLLWMFQRVYMGLPRAEYANYEPVVSREYFIMGALGVAAIILGVLPILIFSLTQGTFDSMAHLVTHLHVALTGNGG